MVDFERARRMMVDNQLLPNGVTDRRILSVMTQVPRERFIPENRRSLSYIDEAIPLGSGGGRFVPQPVALARLIDLAQVRPGDVVLDVGCTTGYSTAVLAGLAEGVVALEDDETFVSFANDTLADLDIGNAAVVQGPLTAGVPSEAPFDVIIIQGAVDVVPQALLDQLGTGGRLAAVIGRGNAATAHLFVKSESETVSRPDFNLAVPPLTAFSQAPAFTF